MTDRLVSLEAGRRFRLAAAFLLHYHDHDKELAGEGVEEILSEVDAGENGDRETLAVFIFAIAELAWRMAGELGPEGAEAFLRGVAANAALSEVMGTTGG